MRKSASISIYRLTVKSPLVKGADALRLLLSFFELLGTYACVRLRALIRSRNTDLLWIDILVVSGNNGIGYIPPKELYNLPTPILAVEGIGLS